MTHKKFTLYLDNSEREERDGEIILIVKWCWELLMLPGMLSLSLCGSDKGFGDVLWIDVVPESIRQSKSRIRGQPDA